MPNLNWLPDPETIRVLRQAGYTQDQIDKAVESLNEWLKLDADFQPTDKDFYLVLQTLNTETASKVHKKNASFRDWKPSTSEVDSLKEDGYWEYIIFEQLLYFKSRYTEQGVIVNKFAFFRSWLRRTIKITNEPAVSWIPPGWLKQLVNTTFPIQNHNFNTLLEGFRKSCLRRDVPNKLICRYFYNYFQHLSKSYTANDAVVID